MSGTADVLVSHLLYARIAAARELPLTILRASDFGDGTMILKVSSPMLPEGYHGSQVAIVDFEKNTVRFTPDNDV